MAPTRFLNFIALVSFAVFYVSLAPDANALAVERAHVARNLNYAHAGIAKKKRDSPTKRCKPRPSSSSPPPASTPPYVPPASPSPSPQPTTTPSNPNPTTTSSSSSSSPPASTPASSSGSGVKVMIAWSNNEETNLCNFKTPDTTMVYNWQMGGYGSIVDPASCGLTYMPMVWGPKDLGQIQSTLVQGFASMAAFYNEPEQPGQSNVDVGTAVGHWFQYFDYLKTMGYKLVSPACTNSDAGFAWIKSFVSQVRSGGGQIDFIATHAYTNNPNDLISFMKGFVTAFQGDKIMLTEYACQDYSGNNQQCDPGSIEQFVVQSNAYFLSEPAIAFTSYFGYFTPPELTANNVNSENSLMNDGSFTPNDLGNKIIYQATS